jgi:chromosome partitioning protein
MGKKIAVVNYKGGVGKTVITINLGAAINSKGKSVLLVDLDPSAALTFALLGKKDVEGSIFNLLTGGRVKPIHIGKSFDLIPSEFYLNSLEQKKIKRKDLLLRDALQDFTSYDFILIDTPPAINIFTVMAALASDSIYTIISADFLSYRSLLAIEDMIEALEENIDHRIIVNLFDRRRNIEKELFRTLKNVYKGALFNSTIRRSVLIPESIFLSKDIFRYRKSSPVARDFEAVAREVIRKEK